MLSLVVAGQLQGVNVYVLAALESLHLDVLLEWVLLVKVNKAPNF